MADSIWWLFFAMASGAGFFTSALLLAGPDKAKEGTKPIAFFLLLFSLTLTQYVLGWSGRVAAFPHLRGVGIISNYLYGPLLVLFFHAGERGLLKRFWPLFLPGALLFLFWLPFFFQPTEMKLEWMQQKPVFDCFLLPTRKFLYLILPLLMAGHQVIYAIYFVWKYRKETNGSRRFKRLVSWLFLLFVAAHVSYFILVKSPFFNSQWDYAISLAMTFAILRIGSLLAYRPDYFFFLKKRRNNEEKYATSPLANGQVAKVAGQVRRHLESNQSYLDPDLRLPTLAEALGMTTHQVSQAVNEQFNCSFSEWVNRYRVGHACQLLAQRDTSSKEAGYQSGFNNLSTFYAAFKKEMGVTPAIYRDQQIGA